MPDPAAPSHVCPAPTPLAATAASPPAVEAERLTRRFGDVTALDAVSLTIRRGEFFSLLGPSGCGKTTLLRLIAGLDLPDSGRLRIGGADALELPAHRRPVNTVFQSYALFPHLDVWNNVAFGLRMKRVPREQLRERVQKSLELVQIPDLAKRRPAQLSGGQRQRVALARAIVNEPAVLLLDEPLGALDLQLRRQLQVELRALQRRLGMTFIHVTHDQDEALTMSDRVALMEAGRIVQLGEPVELYDRPRTRFVARFLGECNLIEGTRPEAVDPAASAVDARTDARMARGWSVDTALGRLQVVNGARDANGSARRAMILAIRPERLLLVGQESGPGTNRVCATIRDAVYSGPETQYVLEAGGTMLRVRVMNHRSEASPHRVGDSVTVELPADALVPLDD